MVLSRGFPMPAAEPTRNPPAEVWMLGRIPPPVTGMTLFTQEVLTRLRSVGPVIFINWSVGAIRRTILRGCATSPVQSARCVTWWLVAACRGNGCIWSPTHKPDST